MKILGTLLLLAALGTGGYFVFFSQQADLPAPDGTGSADTKSPGPSPESHVRRDDGKVEVSAKKPPKAGASAADRESARRRLWEKLRPVSERFLPDPDNVGPCPPVYAGARAARVTRRYLNPVSGSRVWLHEDGSYTELSYGSGTYKDPRTGVMLPREVVVTQVESKPASIAPDELPLVNTSSGKGK